MSWEFDPWVEDPLAKGMAAHSEMLHGKSVDRAWWAVV